MLQSLEKIPVLLGAELRSDIKFFLLYLNNNISYIIKSINQACNLSSKTNRRAELNKIGDNFISSGARC